MDGILVRVATQDEMLASQAVGVTVVDAPAGLKLLDSYTHTNRVENGVGYQLQT